MILTWKGEKRFKRASSKMFTITYTVLILQWVRQAERKHCVSHSSEEKGDIVWVTSSEERGDIVFVTISEEKGDIVWVISIEERGDIVWVISIEERGDIVFFH